MVYNRKASLFFTGASYLHHSLHPNSRVEAPGCRMCWPGTCSCAPQLNSESGDIQDSDITHALYYPTLFKCIFKTIQIQIIQMVKIWYWYCDCDKIGWTLVNFNPPKIVQLCDF